MDPNPTKLLGVQNILEVICDGLLESLAFRLDDVKKILLEMYFVYEPKYGNTVQTSESQVSSSGLSKDKMRLRSILWEGK